MTSEGPSARVTLVGDALYGAMQRFPQSVPYAYTFVDYLSVGAQRNCLLRLEAKDDAIDIGSFRPDHGDGIAFGPQFRFMPRESGGETFQYLQDLAKWVEQANPNGLRAILVLLTEAARLFRAQQLTHGLRSAREPLPKVLHPFAARMRDVVPSNVEIAIRVGNRLIRMVADDAASDLPHACVQAAESGFACWSPCDDNSQLWLAVPCVVSNVAWAIFFTRCARHDWRAGYDLYREALARTLEYCRALVRDTYVFALISALDDALEKKTLTQQSINSTWESLGEIFPFSIPKVVGHQTEPSDRIGLSMSPGAWRIETGVNQTFPAVVPGDNVGPTWADIGDELRMIVERAVQSRFALAKAQRIVLATDIAHEYKNLTSSLVSIANRLLAEASMAGDNDITRQRTDIEFIAALALQANQFALMQFELSARTSKFQFQPHQDSLAIVRAAVRVVLEVEARAPSSSTRSEPLDVCDDLTFEEAIGLLERNYPVRTAGAVEGRFRLVQLIRQNFNVSLLLFAAGEPVRNIRVEEPPELGGQPIKVWTSVSAVGLVQIHQETIEALETNRGPIPTRGVEHVNRLLSPEFCQIEPTVQVTEAVDTGRGNVRIRRVTSMRVVGVPVAHQRDGRGRG